MATLFYSHTTFQPGKKAQFVTVNATQIRIYMTRGSNSPLFCRSLLLCLQLCAGRLPLSPPSKHPFNASFKAWKVLTRLKATHNSILSLSNTQQGEKKQKKNSTIALLSFCKDGNSNSSCAQFFVPFRVCSFVKFSH